jgi:CO/xanthine dehydrogenase Mo-binding subunit
MYRFGKFGAPRSRAEVELGPDGRITLYTSAADHGQGTETGFLRLASETLGVERRALELVNADTLLTPDGDVAGASRATYWVEALSLARAAGSNEPRWIRQRRCLTRRRLH